MSKISQFKTACKDNSTTKTAKIKKLYHLAAHHHRVNVLTSNITFLGGLFDRVELSNYKSRSRACVSTSVRSQNVSSISIEIWLVGRGR